MKFIYTGKIENLTMFGYDFSSGECDVDNPHFRSKLEKLKDFKLKSLGYQATPTTKQLKAELKLKGVEFKVNASKTELQSLIDEANDKNTTD